MNAVDTSRPPDGYLDWTCSETDESDPLAYWLPEGVDLSEDGLPVPPALADTSAWDDHVLACIVSDPTWPEGGMPVATDGAQP